MILINDLKAVEVSLIGAHGVELITGTYNLFFDKWAYLSNIDREDIERTHDRILKILEEYGKNYNVLSCDDCQDLNYYLGVLSGIISREQDREAEH